MATTPLNGQSAASAPMRVQFTLRHSPSHPEIETYARNAITEFHKHFDGVTDCHIILDHQKHDFEHNKCVEITAHVHKHTFVSKESSESYEKAIDMCVEHVCKQLQKHKEKVRQL
jgi:putative sigma-54 modulation protein